MYICWKEDSEEVMLKIQNKEEMINETSLREGNTGPRKMVA